MHAVAPAYQELLNQAKTMELHGEVITWDLKENTSVSFNDLQQALRINDLDETVVRALLPRYAWSRAAKKMMEDSRLIRFLSDANGQLAFQFTKEYKDSTLEQINYDREAVLYLHKQTGQITVESVAPTAQERAQEEQLLSEKASALLLSSMENRTTADVTNIIKRLFGRHADLFPLRSAGGVYFVPLMHSEYVDRVGKFVNFLGGSMTRFPVPKGTPHGDKSVNEAVTEGLDQMIKEYAEALASYGDDTRPSTVEKAIARMSETEFKIEVYAGFLENKAQEMKEQLGLFRGQFMQKLTDIRSKKK